MGKLLYILPDLEPSDISSLYDSYSTVTIWGDRIGSEKSKLERCKYIMANWVGTNGSIANTTIDTRSGIVKHFFRQKVKIIDDFYVTSTAGTNHIRSVTPQNIQLKFL